MTTIKTLAVTCALVLAFVACTDDTGTTEQLSFGEECTTPSEESTECEDGVCSDDFNQLGIVCTLKCTQDDDCPEGSQGKKCNMKGLCRP